MDRSREHASPSLKVRRLRRAVLTGMALLFCGPLAGCAALTNPVADGLPVRRLPPEILAKPKNDLATIPLASLGQPEPDAYRLAPKDVLGVWVEGVLGEKGLPLPVHTSPTRIPGQRILPSAVGYPVPVREDGTLSLPLVAPVPVTGLTLPEAEAAVLRAYAAAKVLAEGNPRVFVTLLQPRVSSVVVLRQESQSFNLGPQGITGVFPSGRRGTGWVLDLPAYENDVLHALAQSGGLPGLDDCNEVIIFRNYFRGGAEAAAVAQHFEGLPPGTSLAHAAGPGVQVLRIPLRALPGSPMPFHPADVVLRTGDVVFLEARDKELFYTGGLLPAGEHVLPRDRDLDVVQAIAQIRGPFLNGAFGVNNLSGTLLQPGIGQPSPSQLTVLRRTPGGGQVPIIVDLSRALRDPRENILVHAGDTLVLQEKPSEALARYSVQTLFNISLTWVPFESKHFTGLLDVFTPNQFPNRISVGSVTTR